MSNTTQLIKNKAYKYKSLILLTTNFRSLHEKEETKHQVEILIGTPEHDKIVAIVFVVLEEKMKEDSNSESSLLRRYIQHLRKPPHHDPTFRRHHRIHLQIHSRAATAEIPCSPSTHTYITDRFESLYRPYPCFRNLHLRQQPNPLRRTPCAIGAESEHVR
ncbi:unnamed protein product [Vicia faba]|uniref:Uncharacterized protein n=1 Tax=Vicia faba TaxID=3906 RepID=A0AAV0YG65_VICFA|nr:unnamed protein product [Vicia faba]